MGGLWHHLDRSVPFEKADDRRYVDDVTVRGAPHPRIRSGDSPGHPDAAPASTRGPMRWAFTP